MRRFLCLNNRLASRKGKYCIRNVSKNGAKTQAKRKSIKGPSFAKDSKTGFLLDPSGINKLIMKEVRISIINPIKMNDIEFNLYKYLIILTII